MRKVINNPDEVVNEMLDGYCRIYSDLVARGENPRVVKSKYIPEKGKVGIVTGGGSGHEPAFCGYVGQNMVDAVAVGEIFSSPSAKMFFDAIKEADTGSGVACLFGNYAGDKMNVKMAIRMAQKEGIEVKTVIANDDVASASIDEVENRRGVAGEILMWKVGAAAAAKGYSLDDVIRVSQKAIDNTRSMGVGLSPCTIPAVGHPNFEIKDGEMEVGIGHHGEPGVSVESIKTSKEIAESMLNKIVNDLPFSKGDKVVVLISGLGSTPLMEQYIFYNDVSAILDGLGIEIYKNYVGNFFTSLEMAGITLTLMKVDEELEELISMPCRSVGFTQD